MVLYIELSILNELVKKKRAFSSQIKTDDCSSSPTWDRAAYRPDPYPTSRERGCHTMAIYHNAGNGKTLYLRPSPFHRHLCLSAAKKGSVV
jgi:hypothetical protein